MMTMDLNGFNGVSCKLYLYRNMKIGSSTKDISSLLEGYDPFNV